MKTALRERARDLGFEDCRVTTADAPESAARFKEWLAEGRQGEMAWLARNVERRIDPQRVLPGARSIITLAASYSVEWRGEREREPLTPALSPSEGERENHRQRMVQSSAALGRNASGAADRKSGVIARYACYADYHDVLKERSKQLAQFVNELGGAGTRSLWYVDTGPLLERDLAQRAGLGFVGKHTNLISRQLGNWFFLAEIVTTLELEPDAPEKNRCGSCARCIAACPTGAITGPFQLDARRCVSYLTIELRGSIPIDLRRPMGNRIFGCDDCLEVCPWNRFAREGQLMKAHARPDLAQPELLELLALDEAGFKRLFAGTPITRAGRRGLRRNVCVALGNTGDASALPALEAAANDADSLVSEHARWAIGQIEGRRAARY